jgi:hypothetical protein
VLVRVASHRSLLAATRSKIGAKYAAKNNAIAELARCDVATREIPDRRLLREVTFDG